jgi:hypothetical protein
VKVYHLLGSHFNFPGAPRLFFGNVVINDVHDPRRHIVKLVVLDANRLLFVKNHIPKLMPYSFFKVLFEVGNVVLKEPYFSHGFV